jgi:hypothetical protein
LYEPTAAVFLIFCFAALAMCIRIRHERLGWGGYWLIDIDATCPVASMTVRLHKLCRVTRIALIWHRFATSRRISNEKRR